ncbi:hypothetical protein I4F81_010654 [Pyropia yezoensis]|uniref:Uncharacterized protein n=1 Tax=Pyropia yezoensis TaxID=2788 RepID=A0ACC3CDW8_PYRYE|nr:hypothetical protein I4F81_010654 [Neopyropia yezoensis]
MGGGPPSRRPQPPLSRRAAGDASMTASPAHTTGAAGAAVGAGPTGDAIAANGPPARTLRGDDMAVGTAAGAAVGAANGAAGGAAVGAPTPPPWLLPTAVTRPCRAGPPTSGSAPPAPPSSVPPPPWAPASPGVPASPWPSHKGTTQWDAVTTSLVHVLAVLFSVWQMASGLPVASKNSAVLAHATTADVVVEQSPSTVSTLLQATLREHGVGTCVAHATTHARATFTVLLHGRDTVTLA